MTTPDEPRDDQPKRRMPWDVPPEQAPGRPSPDAEDTAVFSAQEPYPRDARPDRPQNQPQNQPQGQPQNPPQNEPQYPQRNQPQNQPQSQPPYPPPHGQIYGQPASQQPASYPQAPYEQAPYGTQAPARGGRLGTAALVLGIVAIVLLLVCGLGLLVAIAGVIVGIIAITKRSNKGRAVVGLILSILTLVIGAIIIAVVVNWANKNNIAECFDTRLHPTQESSQQCVQRKLNAPVSEGGY
ncbi:DUF4190 domain-containing protein [Herbidospora mongoliensis]|uniref:DUF4190 domain-containing protein n=1 Tax=Herbidospora mongoliensis TaxID=688067 RepID=UPI000AAD8A4D|nr:DUF4190 domain-containing protein [Herbidospora mongoliensis]